jgi:hypothetical protein
MAGGELDSVVVFRAALTRLRVDIQSPPYRRLEEPANREGLQLPTSTIVGPKIGLGVWAFSEVFSLV